MFELWFPMGSKQKVILLGVEMKREIIAIFLILTFSTLIAQSKPIPEEVKTQAILDLADQCGVDTSAVTIISATIQTENIAVVVWKVIGRVKTPGGTIEVPDIVTIDKEGASQNDDDSDSD
jgi:hypothetical protein